MKRILMTTAAAIAVTGGAPAFAQSGQFADVTVKPGQDFFASDFIGRDVYATDKEIEKGATVPKGTTGNWDDIGEVSDVVVTSDGSVKAVILGVGGFLGMGEHDVAVKMDKIAVKREGENGPPFLVVKASRKALEEAPEFEGQHMMQASKEGGGSGNSGGGQSGDDRSGNGQSGGNQSGGGQSDDAQKTKDDGDSAGQEMQDAAASAGNAAKEAGDAAQKAASNAASSTKDAGQKAGSETKDAAQKAGSETKDAAQDAGNATENAADNAGDAAEGAASNTKDAAQKAGSETKDAAQKAGSETKDAAQDAGNATENAAGNAGNAMQISREGYSEASFNDLAAEDIEDADVYGPGDDKVGEVDKLIMGDNGKKINRIVINVGGFLGIGEKPVAVGFDRLTLLTEDTGDDLRIYIDATEDQLKDMQRYQGAD